jgi:hypothetical protein
MEPHELDKYIGSKIREAENARVDEDINGMNRVWSTIEPQLGNRTSYAWMKVAAVILLLMMPSVYLYLRNREQGRQIRTLNSKLALVEWDYRQKLQALSNQAEKVLIQHDTVRQIHTIENKVIPETVEIVKYVTDTVIIYNQPDLARKLVESEPDVPPADGMNSARQESPLRTEYILSKDANSAKKRKNSRSFQISLGAGHKSAQTEPELAFKTKL